MQVDQTAAYKAGHEAGFRAAMNKVGPYYSRLGWDAYHIAQQELIAGLGEHSQQAKAAAYNKLQQEHNELVAAYNERATDKPSWQVEFEKEGYVTAQTISLRDSLSKAKAERDAAQKALAEEQAKSKSLYENQQDIADTNKRVCERLLVAEAERDASLARIATLEQQLTDAAGRINELEADQTYVQDTQGNTYKAISDGEVIEPTDRVQVVLAGMDYTEHAGQVFDRTKHHTHFRAVPRP